MKRSISDSTPGPSDGRTAGRTTAVEAYELLLDAIDGGTLLPGSRLREADLALRFGISRTPVREALRRLESQGLVSHQPHRGTVVTEFGFAELTELYALREVLEGTAARLAALYATPSETAVLQEMIDHDKLIIDKPQELARRNKLFHRQIHQSARNRFLSTVLDNMRTSLALLAGTTLSAPGRASCSLEEHQTIVRAIAEGDSVAAEAAARAHIVNAFKTRLKLRVEDGPRSGSPF